MDRLDTTTDCTDCEKRIRAESLDEFVKELEKCVAMQWVDIHDIWDIAERLKEQNYG